MYIRYGVTGAIFTIFVAIDNVTRPNAEQITDLVLKLLHDYISWKPPTVVIGENEDMTNISEEEDNIEPEVIERNQVEEECIGDESDISNDEYNQEDSGDDAETYVIDFEESEKEELDPGNKPLLVGITTDGARVLTEKNLAFHKRLKEKCNKILLSTHCLPHRMQLSLKECLSTLKGLYEFCEEFFNFHHKSTVVSNVFPNSVKALSVQDYIQNNLIIERKAGLLKVV